MVNITREEFESLIDSLKFDVEFKKDMYDKMPHHTLYRSTLRNKIDMLEDLTQTLDFNLKAETKPYLIAVNPKEKSL